MGPATQDQAVINEPILFEEHLRLPDITFFAEHYQEVKCPDTPDLSGAHIHNDYEVYVHVVGSGYFLVENRAYPLGRGDVILTKPGDVHVRILDDAGMTEHFCLWLPPACDDHLLPFTKEPLFCPHLVFSEDTKETISCSDML